MSFFSYSWKGIHSEQSLQFTLQQNLREAGMSDLVLFAHAVSGCDTTSAIFKEGKATTWKKIADSNEELKNELRRFNEEHLSKADAMQIGDKFLLKLYGAKHETAT